MFEFLIGVLTGVFTGVLPSIHINTVAFLLAASEISTNFISFALFVVGLSVSHNFFDFVPAIVFGSGEEGTAISSFAANRMFMQGRGLLALKLLSIGALMGSVFFLVLLPLISFFLPLLFDLLSSHAWVLLLWISLHLIVKDSSVRYALLIFVSSGLLGILVLENEFLSFPLLSLFSGLFGVGILWDNFSFGSVPSQISIHGIALRKFDVLKQGFAGLLSSVVLGLVPAIGPTQASVLTYSDDEESFLVKIGVVNVADVFISLMTLFLAGKARSGALAELQKFGNLGFEDLMILFVACFSSAVVAFWLLNIFGSRILRWVSKINYAKIVLFGVVFIMLINFLFNGFSGVVVCMAGAVISKKAMESGVMKSHCMGVLIIPTLLNYLAW